jgi:hypothetical protein
MGHRVRRRRPGHRRVRAQEREEANAPRYLADELAATAEKAADARADATLWASRAAAPDVDPGQREQLRAAAEEAARKADELELQVAQLEYADHARARFYVHNAATRDRGERSAAELRARGVDPDDTSDRVTAAEWLATHDAAQAEDDAHREVHDEYELHDLDQRDHRGTALGDNPAQEHATAQAAHEREPTVPAEPADDAARRRVPARDDTAADVARAQEMLA